VSVPVVASTVNADTVESPTLPVNTKRPATSDDIAVGNDPVEKGEPEIEVSEPELWVMLYAETLLETALVA